MPISGRPMLGKRDIIHAFFIPRKVKGKVYWLKRGIYIYRKFERTYFGDYPDRYFTDVWVNKCLTTKANYKRYKQTGKFPIGKKYK